jgi:hypothetical protein
MSPVLGSGGDTNPFEGAASVGGLFSFYENATRGAVLSDPQCPKYFNDSCQKIGAS